MLDRVPYEIFSKIIKLSYKHFGVFDDEETLSLPPIEATHVCRSWRTALLSDPTMWTCIKLDFTGRISGELKEMLSRSGSAPLDVLQIGYSSDPLQSEFADLIHILSHVHRFRNLQMFIPAEHANMIFPLLEQPAPILQKLHLEVRESTEREWATLGEAYQNLFLGNAPNLKYAHLQIFAGLKELQSVSLFKNLSSLHLCFASSMVIDGDILLGILYSSPSLRIFEILFPFFFSSPKIVCSMPSNHRIPLSCLQKLSLEGRCGVDIVDFALGYLDFPADKVDFDITCDDVHSKISDSTLLLHFLAQRHLSLLSISSNGWVDTAIELFENVDLGFPASSPRLKEVFRVLYSDYAPLDSPSNLLRKFKMSDITHMHLDIIAFESAVLRSIFLLLDNLQHLQVNYAGLSWVRNLSLDKDFPDLKALTPRVTVQHSNPQTEVTASESGIDDRTDSEPDDDAISQAHLFPCPSLHTLELAFPDPFEESYIRELIQCSKIREQTGHPFKSITIYCRCSALAESARAWLQTHEFGRLHVEVTLWSMDY